MRMQNACTKGPFLLCNKQWITRHIVDYRLTMYMYVVYVGTYDVRM